MCEGRASFAVDRDGVEGACDEHEVLSISLLTRPRSDRGRSCKRVNSHCFVLCLDAEANKPFELSKNYERIPVSALR